MEAVIPLVRDLVLVGGGHAHALLLRMWAMDPLPGAALTVIDPGASVAYSGMLPGFVAGHYTRDQLDINLVRLARAAGARLILGRAVGLNRDARRVRLGCGREVSYDLLSLDVGIHSRMEELPGFAEHGVAVKPLGAFARAWERQRNGSGPIAVIGGGLAGVELALAMAHGGAAPVHLIDRGAVLDGIPARSSLCNVLADAGVVLHENTDVERVVPGAVIVDGGARIEARFVTGAAGARPYEWLAETGLEAHQGFVSVGPTLQSSDPAVFAVGDCAHLSFAPRPKAGVYAVRAASVLAHNLRVALRERGRMRRFRPQRDYLKLVSLGGKRALAEKAGWVVQGRALWRLKDRIDRKFMRQFADLPVMAGTAMPRVHAAGVLETTGGKPLCGGCGAKVGPGALRRALDGLPGPLRADVETLPGDDAALLRVGGVRQVLTTDHLRGVVEDPALMARISAVHALGDVWAMGARPQAAVAQVVLPRMSTEMQARRMAEVVRAARDVLTEAGADLVGGHSSMGDALSIGFSVTGLCDGDPITLAGARPGDAVILTKPIGSGTILAADMAGLARAGDVVSCWGWMERGQARAAELLADAHAMTDVTGFGLAGHLWNICVASGVAMRIDPGAVPVMAGARELARRGVRSSLWADNRAAVPGIAGDIDPLLFDPQTAGGLLACVPDGAAAVAALRVQGLFAAWIGNVEPGPARILVGAGLG